MPKDRAVDRIVNIYKVLSPAETFLWSVIDLLCLRLSDPQVKTQVERKMS